MIAEERIRASGDFSALAGQLFAAGNAMAGAEMLYGALTQVIIALAMVRGEPFQDHQHRRHVIRQLVAELNDHTIRRDFSEANRLHVYFYHRNMTPQRLADAAEATRELTNRLLSMLPPAEQS